MVIPIRYPSFQSDIRQLRPPSAERSPAPPQGLWPRARWKSNWNHIGKYIYLSLSICQSIYISANDWSIYLFQWANWLVYLSIDWSISLSIYLYICLSVLSVNLSTYLSVCLSIYLISSHLILSYLIYRSLSIIIYVSIIDMQVSTPFAAV